MASSTQSFRALLLSSSLHDPPRSRSPAISIPVPICLPQPPPRRRSVAVVAAVAPEGGKPRYMGTWMREARLGEMIEAKVAEAKAACEGQELGGSISEECKVAWDEVEEVSRAKADLRHRLAHSSGDPLESFCQENPESDECRIYDP